MQLQKLNVHSCSNQLLIIKNKIPVIRKSERFEHPPPLYLSVNLLEIYIIGKIFDKIKLFNR